jgi:glycosyltransferase involved in cell wall biosynthesis
VQKIVERTVDCLICVHSKDEHYDHMLLRAISSVLDGTVKPNNLVIVYDACWPKTQRAVESLFTLQGTHGVTYIPAAKTVKNGLANAKNFGLKFCAGQYITYCDADDQWTPDKLELQLKYLNKFGIIKTNIDFLSTECWDLYPNGDKKESYYKCGDYESHNAIVDCLSRGENPLVHGSMLIMRNAIEKLGGYRDIRGVEDMDLWIRAINAGYRFAKMPIRAYIYSMGTGVTR